MRECLKHICFDKDGIIIDVHAYWGHIIQKRALKIIQYFELSSGTMSPLAWAMGVDLSKRKITPGGPVGYKPRPAVAQAAVNYLKTKGVETSCEVINKLFSEVDQQMQQDEDYNIRMIPDADKALKEIKDLGFLITLFSSDRRDNMQNNFKVLNIDHLIDAYVGGDDVSRPKPDPEGFLLACQKISIPVATSIYIGDTLDDMMVAKRSGCSGYGLTTGLCSREELQNEAKDVFNSLGELVQCLRKAKNSCIMPR